MTDLAPEPVRIPLFDLRLDRDHIDAVANTLRSGRLAMAGRTEEFETAFADHLGVRHAVAVSTCTAALHLAYLAAGVGRGDEVIVPSFTFAATASAVLYCGATPVFADIVGLADPVIDPTEVKRLIGPRTKAVAAVHYAGYAAPVHELRRICDDNGVALVEDAAHSPSAELDGRKLGTFGLAGCFSLFSNKVLSVGEGGVLATDADDVARLARSLRSPGGYGEGRPWNYRLDEPRATLAASRLRRLEDDIERRRELVVRYRERLSETDGITLPFSDADVAHSSCYVMPTMIAPGRRDDVRRVLNEDFAVQTSILYPAVHEFTAYRERFPGTALDRTERAARSQLTLPLFPHMTTREQDRVVSSLARALER